MTLQNILLLGVLIASISTLISIIRFANKTVKIRQIWDSALDTNSLSRNR